MHELGIVIDIVKQVEAFMDQHDIKNIQTLTLEIGALSGVYPKYIEDVYPIAVEKSRLKDTKLKIDITPGLVKCSTCGLRYDVIENHHRCPKCQGEGFEVISGKDFLIKSIEVMDS